MSQDDYFRDASPDPTLSQLERISEIEEEGLAQFGYFENISPDPSPSQLQEIAEMEVEPTHVTAGTPAQQVVEVKEMPATASTSTLLQGGQTEVRSSSPQNMLFNDVCNEDAHTGVWASFV